MNNCKNILYRWESDHMNNITQKNPMVSVIIPTYNRANLIERAIRSVQCQTYEDFEIIVVDDGSTDGTKEVVQGIDDERIKYIKSPVNRGQANARNIGIRRAKGKYIAFQDSDDVWLSEKLEKQVKVLEQADETVGMVYTMFQYQNGQENDARPYPPKELSLDIKRGFIFPHLFAGNLVGMPTVLIRREIIDKVGMFDTKFSCLEDYEWVLRIAKRYQVEIVEEVLVHTYFTNSSVSSSKLEEAKVCCQIILMYKKEIERYHAKEDMLWRIRSIGAKIGAEQLVEELIEVTLQHI